jgi:hypothetical protein
MWDTRFMLDLIDAVYLASVLGNRPRPIDRYIDYFGDGPRTGAPRGRRPMPDPPDRTAERQGVTYERSPALVHARARLDDDAAGHGRRRLGGVAG